MVSPITDRSLVYTLGLKPGVLKVLRRARLDTVERLVSQTATDLLNIEGFGYRMLKVVTEALAAHGFALKLGMVRREELDHLRDASVAVLALFPRCKVCGEVALRGLEHDRPGWCDACGQCEDGPLPECDNAEALRALADALRAAAKLAGPSPAA